MGEMQSQQANGEEPWLLPAALKGDVSGGEDCRNGGECEL